MDIAKTTGGAPTREHVAALEQHVEQLQRAVDELSMLNELAGEIGALHDLDDVMQTILHRSLRMVQADQGVITILQGSDEKETLRTLVRSTTESHISSPLRPTESLLGWMHRYHAPLRVNRPREDPRFTGVAWPDAVVSALCAPLSVRGRMIGIITLYNKKGGATFSDADLRLLAIVASQSAQVIENARLFEEEKMLMRMQEELRLAYEIQTSLLPGASPELAGYDIKGASVPAQEVGGDYFDFIPLDPEHVVLAVADVVGKGLPASLLMATTQATLRGQTIPGVSVAETLDRANDLLCRSTKRGKFVTIFQGMLDGTRHTLTYANAGHNRPILRRSGGDITYLSEAGIVLGVQKGWKYRQAVLELQPQDMLLIYSDGLTEAMNVQREQFGEARVEDILHTARHEGAENVLQMLLEAVRDHAGDEPQSDDITIIVVRRNR